MSHVCLCIVPMPNVVAQYHPDCPIHGALYKTKAATPTPKEGPPNVDVPLENQTQESLIAYIHSLEKYQKELEVIVAAAREVRHRYGNIGSDHKAEIESVRGLSLALNNMDDLHLKARQ